MVGGEGEDRAVVKTYCGDVYVCERPHVKLGGPLHKIKIVYMAASGWVDADISFCYPS